MVVHPTAPSISAQDFWSSFRVTVGFFPTSLTKDTFLPNAHCTVIVSLCLIAGVHRQYLRLDFFGLVFVLTMNCG